MNVYCEIIAIGLSLSEEKKEVAPVCYTCITVMLNSHD